MKKIIAPITQDSDKEVIANLQEVLLFLLENKKILAINDQARDRNYDGLKDDLMQQLFGDYTDGVIKIFQKENGLNTSGIADDITAEKLNGFLLSEPEYNDDEYLIKGYVKSLIPMVEGLRVTFYEFDISGSTEIGAIETKPNGWFEYGFIYNDTYKAGDSDTAPDLTFKVFDADGNEQFIESVEIISPNTAVASRLGNQLNSLWLIINSHQNLEFIIHISASSRPITEFEKLVAKLTPFLSELKFTDLKEDDENFQISFLSKESGVEKNKIEKLKYAFQQEGIAEKVPAWVFFGLTDEQHSLEAIRFLSSLEIEAKITPLQPSKVQNDLKTIAANLLEYLSAKTGQIDPR